MAQLTVYHAPRSIAEVLSYLNELGKEGTILAGGQDIVPSLNQGLLPPCTLIDLKMVKPLYGIETENGSVRINALSTHREIERSSEIRSRVGLLAAAASQIGGGVQVRNRGTIGGAVCAANPAYDFAPCLVALDAEFLCLSSDGERRVPAHEFFSGTGATTLRSNELMVAVSVPAHDLGTGFAYQKLKFSDGCYCIASAACIVKVNPEGICQSVRVTLGGVASMPIQVREIESMLAGSRVTEKLLVEAASIAKNNVTEPISDLQADGEYRRAMAGVMCRRAISAAIERAHAE